MRGRLKYKGEGASVRPSGLCTTVFPGDGPLTCDPFLDGEGPFLQLRPVVVLVEGHLSLISQPEGARCQRIITPIRFTFTVIHGTAHQSHVGAAYG